MNTLSFVLVSGPLCPGMCLRKAKHSSHIEVLFSVPYIETICYCLLYLFYFSFMPVNSNSWNCPLLTSPRRLLPENRTWSPSSISFLEHFWLCLQLENDYSHCPGWALPILNQYENLKLRHMEQLSCAHLGEEGWVLSNQQVLGPGLHQMQGEGQMLGSPQWLGQYSSKGTAVSSETSATFLSTLYPHWEMK